MRRINYIVIHCSATRAGQTVTAADVDSWHRKRGFAKIGYHWFVRLDGELEKGRDETEVGAHVQGHNSNSIGICYAGGLDTNGKSADTRTPQQLIKLESVVRDVLSRYPNAKVCGHRDLSPDRNGDGKITKNEYLKDCPCHDVAAWLTSIGLGAHALTGAVK